VARWLLILTLVSGLVPSLGEGVELVVHYAATGHLAHFQPGEADLADTGPEHGCGPLAHHCGCCHSQPVLTQAQTRLVQEPSPATERLGGDEGQAAIGIHSRLLRPPIGA
jgi:hypothetical protein